MIFSTDLDEVWRDHQLGVIRAVWYRYGVKLTRQHFSVWDANLAPVFEAQGVRVSWAELLTFLWSDPLTFELSTPVPGALDAARMMARQGRIIINTSTSQPDMTEWWLRRWGFPYDAVCHTSHKTEVVRAYGCHIHIDDSPSQVEKFQKAGQPMLCFDLGWNRHLAERGQVLYGWSDPMLAKKLSIG